MYRHSVFTFTILYFNLELSESVLMCWTVTVFSVFGILFSSVVAILSFKYCLWFNVVLCVTSQFNYRNFSLSIKYYFF